MIKQVRKDYRQKVSSGYKRMTSLRIAVCALARDCGPQLNRIIPMVERIRGAFKESYVIVVENDSIDNTKAILQQWAASDSNVTILSEDTHSKTILDSGEDISNPFFSTHRIGKMAAYRNKYLDQLEAQHLDIDYLLIVDVDIHEIVLEGIAHSFGQTIDWDMVSSNGLFPLDLKHFYKGYRYYDGYALREFGDTNPQSKEMAFFHQKLYSGLTPGMPMLHVASAFNGLAIYKWEAVKGLRYHCDPNDDEEIKAVCEHINLHRQMAERGHDKIYINPAQIVYYDRYSNLLRQAVGLSRKNGKA